MSFSFITFFTGTVTCFIGRALDEVTQHIIALACHSICLIKDHFQKKQYYFLKQFKEKNASSSPGNRTPNTATLEGRKLSKALSQLARWALLESTRPRKLGLLGIVWLGPETWGGGEVTVLNSAPKGRDSSRSLLNRLSLAHYPCSCNPRLGGWSVYGVVGGQGGGVPNEHLKDKMTVQIGV